MIVGTEPSKSKIALESIYSLPLKIVEATSQIVMLANEIAKKHRVGGYDAVHIATSIAEKADYIITNDRQFKRLTEVEVVSPLQYVTLRG